jgi:hypothetical protein
MYVFLFTVSSLVRQTTPLFCEDDVASNNMRLLNNELGKGGFGFT